MSQFSYSVYIYFYLVVDNSAHFCSVFLYAVFLSVLRHFKGDALLYFVNSGSAIDVVL